MVLLDRIRERLEKLDEKEFFKYAALFLGIVCALAGIIIIRYYFKTSSLNKQMKRVNVLREDVKQILDRYEMVKKQQEEINALLDENEDFILAEYIERLRTELRLTYTVESRTTASRDDKYQEIAINVKFTNMNMKDLTELLQEIKKNKLVYTKDLDILKSKARPGTLDVSITIATLKKIPKTEAEGGA
jgi:hypothetical protein